MAACTLHSTVSCLKQLQGDTSAAATAAAAVAHRSEESGVGATVVEGKAGLLVPAVNTQEGVV